MSNCCPPSVPGCCDNGASVKAVCGDFECPETPDKGHCSPYREKRTCEAPTKPQNPCNDTAAYAEARPGESPPFVIIATIFDENCLPILDENSLPIMGQY